ncbi:MAG: redoxin domain-containing protein [Colwellia sp.]|nr:redoxin domain-containing protein [Colwellia sp.]
MSFLKKLSVAIFIWFLFGTSTSFAESIAFDNAKLAAVKAQNMGKQWLMLLWSVDCPPCFKELANIQKLQRQHHDLAVVIINTDDNDEIKSERKEIIEKFELSTFTNFHFVDGKGDQSRFFIDPNWYGELPRSYFVESNGKFNGKSGLVNKPILMKWLVN